MILDVKVLNNYICCLHYSYRTTKLYSFKWFAISQIIVSHDHTHVVTVSHIKYYVVYITVTELWNLLNSFKGFTIPGRIVVHNYAHVIRVSHNYVVYITVIKP